MSAKNNLKLGYQRLLYYRHRNGAFSAFGLTEEKSSTWLTAYVARAFSMASEFIQIDESILQTALNYLTTVQNSKGGFDERGDEFEQFRDSGISLSAFVTLAFMENLVCFLLTGSKISLWAHVNFRIIVSGSLLLLQKSYQQSARFCNT